MYRAIIWQQCNFSKLKDINVSEFELQPILLTLTVFFIYSTFSNTLTPTKGNKRFWRSSSSFRKSTSSSNWPPVHWKLMSRKLFTMWLVTSSLVEAVMLPQDQQWRLARGLCKLRSLKRRSEPNLWHWSRETFSRQGKELWQSMSLKSLSVKLPTNWRLMLLKIESYILLDNPGLSK